jgi:exonuclease SbcD
MKLLICSDTHLGHKNFKVDEREKDFESVFSQIIEYALNNEISAVVHAGDLFDAGRPSIRTIIFTIKELRRLKDKSIPFFTIAGNHDISVDESFLNVLDKLGLIYHLSEKKNYAKFEGITKIKGEYKNGLFAAGLYAKDSLLNNPMQLTEIDFPKEACFKVFLFHHIISDINSPGVLIKKTSLPKGFDLYVSGHWHGAFETTIYNKPLLYPGSTENWDFREIVEREKKGFYLFDTATKKHDFIRLDVRESEVINFNCNSLSSDDVIIELIKKVGAGAGRMLFFRLDGRLKSGNKSVMNKQEVYDAALKAGYLFCKVYDGSLSNHDEEQLEIKTKSISELESDFFKNKGFSSKELLLAIDLLDILGRDASSSEREQLINEAVNKTREVLL